MTRKNIRANCTETLCSRCNGRGHTADVCPTSKEEAVLAVTGEAEARVDVSVWTLPYKLLLVWKLLNFTAAGVDSAIYLSLIHI